MNEMQIKKEEPLVMTQIVVKINNVPDLTSYLNYKNVIDYIVKYYGFSKVVEETAYGNMTYYLPPLSKHNNKNNKNHRFVIRGAKQDSLLCNITILNILNKIIEYSFEINKPTTINTLIKNIMEYKNV